MANPSLRYSSNSRGYSRLCLFQIIPASSVLAPTASQSGIKELLMKRKLYGSDQPFNTPHYRANVLLPSVTAGGAQHLPMTSCFKPEMSLPHQFYPHHGTQCSNTYRPLKRPKLRSAGLCGVRDVRRSKRWEKGEECSFQRVPGWGLERRSGELSWRRGSGRTSPEIQQGCPEPRPAFCPSENSAFSVSNTSACLNDLQLPRKENKYKRASS